MLFTLLKNKKMKSPKMDGQVFWIMQKLKKAAIPVRKMEVLRRECISYSDKGKMKWVAIFEADSWAAKKAMHPIDGCNPEFTIWDSKIRGKAKIAFIIT